MLSVLLRYTDSDYPFGIFKIFLLKITLIHNTVTTFNIYDICVNNVAVDINFMVYIIKIDESKDRLLIQNKHTPFHCFYF